MQSELKGKGFVTIASLGSRLLRWEFSAWVASCSRGGCVERGAEILTARLARVREGRVYHQFTSKTDGVKVKADETQAASRALWTVRPPLCAGWRKSAWPLSRENLQGFISNGPQPSAL